MAEEGALSRRSKRTIPPHVSARIAAWTARQPAPKPSRAEAIVALIIKGLDADEKARPDEGGEAALATFYEQEKQRAAESRSLKARHRTAPHAEAQASVEASAARAKELAIGAVKQALANVDATDDVKLERKRKLVARRTGRSP